jgi:predicted transcriptional regulator
MENEKLIELTADIVAAHVANNSVSVGDMPTLVQRIHEALSSLNQPEESARPAKTAIVSARASVKPDYLVCMECGGKHKMLKRHIMNAHGLTPDQYRADYGLPREYPMVAPNYSEQRRTLAHAIGLGRRRGPATGGGEGGAAADAGGGGAGGRGGRKGGAKPRPKPAGKPGSGNGRRRKKS